MVKGFWEEFKEAFKLGLLGEYYKVKAWKNIAEMTERIENRRKRKEKDEMKIDDWFEDEEKKEKEK